MRGGMGDLQRDGGVEGICGISRINHHECISTFRIRQG